MAMYLDFHLTTLNVTVKDVLDRGKLRAGK